MKRATLNLGLLFLLCPTLLLGQETGLLRISPDNLEPSTHVAAWGGYENGRFRPYQKAISEWNAGAEARRVAQRPHTTLTGAISFEQTMGKYHIASLLLDPYHYPMDVLDLGYGTVSQQDLRLEGGFLTDVTDILQAGLKGSVRGQHASQRNGLPFGTFGVSGELEPVVTYLIDDDICFIASYRGQLRTEKVDAKAASEEEGLDGIFMDEGMGFGTYSGLGSGGTFSILEYAHGFKTHFHSPEESWGGDMLWKRGSANGNDNQYRFPGSTLHLFFDYNLAAEKLTHVFGVSFQRDRDQLRLLKDGGSFSSLSDRVVRNGGLKYGFQFPRGVFRNVFLVLDANQRINRAFPAPGIMDKTILYDGSATLLASLSSGNFDLTASMMAGGGRWRDRGLATSVDDVPEGTTRATKNWLQEMEFYKAPQIGLGGTLTARIPSVDGLSLRFHTYWRRGFQVKYLGGKNRSVFLLTLAYDY